MKRSVTQNKMNSWEIISASEYRSPDEIPETKGGDVNEKGNRNETEQREKDAEQSKHTSTDCSAIAPTDERDNTEKPVTDFKDLHADLKINEKDLKSKDQDKSKRKEQNKTNIDVEDEHRTSLRKAKMPAYQKKSENTTNHECPFQADKNHSIPKTNKNTPLDIEENNQNPQTRCHETSADKEEKRDQMEQLEGIAHTDPRQHSTETVAELGDFPRNVKTSEEENEDLRTACQEENVSIAQPQEQSEEPRNEGLTGSGKMKSTQVQKQQHGANLVLVGRIGNGKSATGNSILGKKVFTPRSTNVSGPTEILKGNLNDNGINVTIVDGFNVGDETERGSCDDYEISSINIIEKCDGIVTAFVLVLKYGIRFTRQEKEAVKVVRSYFGENVLKSNGVIVISHGDNFDLDMEDEGRSFEDWCDNQRGDVKDLFEECGSRIVLFNNKAKDLEVETRQREQLMDKINEIKEDYTATNFSYAAVKRYAL